MTTVTYRRVNIGAPARSAALCLLALAATLLQSQEARAQWTAPDAAGNINTTNTGNVGVGTTAPSSKLEVKGSTSDASASAVKVTDSTGRGLFFVNNNGQVSVGAAATWGTLGVLTPAGTRSGVSIVGDGDQWVYSDLVMSPMTSTGIAAGKPTSFIFSLMKNNPAYGGDASGPSFALSAPRQGGGTYVPFIVNPNGNVILAGASNAVNGNVGIGTAAPTFLLDVMGSANTPFRVRDTTGREYFSTGTRTGPVATWVAPVVSIAGARLIVDSTTPDGNNDTLIRRMVNSLIFNPSDHPTLPGAFMVRQVGGYAGLFVDQNTNGNVGIGTTAPASKLHVAGNITVDGNINAKYQDVAEWVPSTQKLNAGTVVILDVERDNHVAASSTSYDTRVAGVISAQPGISLGEQGEGKVLVATTGRVKVRVDATQGPIKVGDLLVTSDRAGYAMKSEAVMVGKRPMHSPGTIIGKALESLAEGTGEILVLLSLQ